MTLEAAQRVHPGSTLRLLAREVRARVGVQAALVDREAMEGAVKLAVAYTVEAVTIAYPGGDRDWRYLGESGELGV